MYTKVVNLVPPQLSDQAIKEKIICIRGHRERMFNTSYEQINNQFVFHNYGHGGAGWTFLFGCVNESLRQFEQQVANYPSLKKQAITIIGAGCYGLLTAIELARRGYHVRIVAREQTDISSHKAAGFFFPRPRKVSNELETAIFHARGIESYQTYLSIIKGSHPFITHGPKLLPAYYDINIDPGFTPYVAHKLVTPPQTITIDFGNGKKYPAHQYETLFINPAALMDELKHLIKQLDVPILKQEIEKFDDLDESIIFNCAGLGAKKLTNDLRLIPVQGHLITLQKQPIEQLQYLINFKVTMPAAKGNYLRNELLYFAPKNEGILGITFIRGQDSFTNNQHEFDRLLERAHLFFGA